MLYYFKKGKNASETQKKIGAVYGEYAVTDRTCQKWFVKFCAVDFSLDDAPRLGRLVEVDSNQIKTLIENTHCYTTWVIAVILKISKSIKLLVKMKNKSFILWKKLNGLFGQPNIRTLYNLGENSRLPVPTSLFLSSLLTVGHALIPCCSSPGHWPPQLIGLPT